MPRFFGITMDTALAGTMVGMQGAQTAQSFALVAMKQEQAMAASLVDLLASAAETSKAMLADGVGSQLDRSA